MERPKMFRPENIKKIKRTTLAGAAIAGAVVVVSSHPQNWLTEKPVCTTLPAQTTFVGGEDDGIAVTIKDWSEEKMKQQQVKALVTYETSAQIGSDTLQHAKFGVPLEQETGQLAVQLVYTHKQPGPGCNTKKPTVFFKSTSTKQWLDMGVTETDIFLRDKPTTSPSRKPRSHPPTHATTSPAHTSRPQTSPLPHSTFSS